MPPEKSKKPAIKLDNVPPAKMFRQGSYRFISGPGKSVLVRHSSEESTDISGLNNTDLLLLAVDAGWEKAEQAYYQGLEEGFATGYSQGISQGRSEAQQTALAMEHSLNSVESSLLKFYSDLERWTVKLAMKIAEKIIGKAADEQENLVHQTVRRALAEVADKTKVLVKVNPADYEALKDFRTSVTALTEGIEHFKIEADSGITPGSCRIETPSGLLDADFTTQISELRRALVLQEEAKE
jgi:flagellar assembly protein FliH